MRNESSKPVKGYNKHAGYDLEITWLIYGERWVIQSGKNKRELDWIA